VRHAKYKLGEVDKVVEELSGQTKQVEQIGHHMESELTGLVSQVAALNKDMRLR
jgi:hypothetical protein